MSNSWRERAFSTEEAANMAGLCRASVDLWIHRFPHDDFSERRGGRRWFSPRDIAALRVALALNRVMPLAEALPTALQHLAHPPIEAAFLVGHRGRTFTADADTAAQRAVEAGAIVVPIGRIAAEVQAACDALYQQPA